MAYIGKVPADVLIDPMVDSAAITDATIVTADLANDAVTSAKLAADSVDSSELIDGSVDNVHLAGSIAVNKTLLAGGTGLTLSTNTLNVDAAQTQITSVGTIGTGVWNGTAVASAYLDADTAHLSTTQTFTGAKTFSEAVTFSKDANADYKTKIYNANAGSSTEANLYITNSSSDADGLFAGVGGTGFTTASGYVQDSAWVGSGTGAGGGLSIMTRADADMRFYTNGHTNQRMIIKNDGKVGIGTTAPDEALHVYSGTGSAGSNLGTMVLGMGRGNSSGEEGWILTYDEDNDNKFHMKWNNVGTESTRMTIDSGGNVGFGTSSPDTLLHISAGSAGSVAAHSDTRLVVEDDDNCTIATLAPDANWNGFQMGSATDSTGAILQWNYNAKQLYLGATPSTDGGIITFHTGTGTERMRIDEVGNIGIKETCSSPQAHGNNWGIHLPDNYQIGFGNGANSRPDFGIMGDSSNLNIYCGEGSDTIDIKINTNGTIVGDTAGSFCMANGEGSASSPSFCFHSDTNTGMFRAANTVLGFTTGGTERLRITGTGDIWHNNGNTVEHSLVGHTNEFNIMHHWNSGQSKIYFNYRMENTYSDFAFYNGGSGGHPDIEAASFTTTSDYRMKKSVTNFTDNVCDKIKLLKPITYNWKANTKMNEARQIGFLAHELQEQLPLAVKGEKDAMNDKGDIAAQSIKGEALSSYMMKALQEIITRLEALENA